MESPCGQRIFPVLETIQDAPQPDIEIVGMLAPKRSLGAVAPRHGIGAHLLSNRSELNQDLRLRPQAGITAGTVT